ncbi:MAG TPA: carbon-nitrogen hydrolase family protein [Afifellaceae bacterium]|nr:carbon-nitrogen hydrolase family protein [Afifellaceae bacterium]
MTFRAALIQLNSSTDIAGNIASVDALVREAAAAGAQYVQTPEMTNIVQRDRAALQAAIFPTASDPAIAAFAALAGELGIVLHIGSLALDAGGGRIANRAFVFAPDGSQLARYDKIHLFDVDLPGGESWRESAVYTPGAAAVIADLPWCRLGVSICYDLRFPQLYRAYARAGSVMLSAPAAFTRQTGEAHWNVLQRARAIENGAFMASAAQAGLHDDERETYGHSIIVSPWGEVLAEADGETPQVVLAEIDPAEAADARARIPALKNERAFSGPDISQDAAPPLRSVS